MLHFLSTRDLTTDELVVTAREDHHVLAVIRVPFPGTLEEVVDGLRTAVCTKALLAQMEEGP